MGCCEQVQVQEGAVASVQDGVLSQYQPHRLGFGLWGTASEHKLAESVCGNKEANVCKVNL